MADFGDGTHLRQIVAANTESLPVWISTAPDDISRSSGLVNLRLKKSYGLDDLFHRVAAEKFLLSRDLQRLTAVIEDCKDNISGRSRQFQGLSGYRGRVEASDERFLVQRRKRLQRASTAAYANSFTRLFLESAEQLLREDQTDVQLLPDLHGRESYSREELTAAGEALADMPCASLLTLRGAAVDAATLDALTDTLSQSEDGKVAVALEYKPYDGLTESHVDAVRRAMSASRAVSGVAPVVDSDAPLPLLGADVEKEAEVPRTNFKELQREEERPPSSSAYAAAAFPFSAIVVVVVAVSIVRGPV